MFCTSCGKKLVDQSNFCGNCGAAAEQDSLPSIEEDSPPSLDNHEVGELEETQRPKAPRIGFRNAVKSGFQNAFNLETRSTRAEYWWWVLFFCLWLFMGAAILFAVLEGLGVALSDNEVTILATLPLLPSSLSVAVRRLHDANISGWLVLLNFIPVIGSFIVLILCLIPGNPEENRWRRLH